MNISPHILDEAKTLLGSREQKGLKLPVQLESASEFYLAESKDETVLAFTAFEVEGVEYKIGVRKV